MNDKKTTTETTHNSSFTTHNSRVPRLRFPEFREDPGWEKSHLEDIANFIRKRIASKCVSKENYIGTENLLPEFGGIKDASSLPATSTVVEYKENDILISNIRPYLKKIWLSNRRGGASSDVLVIRSDKVNYIFLFSVLASDGFIAYVMRNAKGVKMPRGDISSIKKYPVFVPSSKEQQKIADCLSSVDALIGLQGRKVEQLARHKQALLQQLFPADGKTTPHLRFPEYRTAPAWDEKRLGDFMSESRIVGSKGDVAKKLTVKLWGKGVFAKNDEIKGSQNTQYYRRKAGQIIYSKLDFLNQAFGVIPEELEGYESTIDLPAFDVSEEASEFFILEYIKRKDFFLKVGEVADGSRKAKRIHPETFLSYPVYFPKKEEQQKIANCLSSLDTLIDLHRRKLEALKRHKRGLMQQLFPSFDEVYG